LITPSVKWRACVQNSVFCAVAKIPLKPRKKTRKKALTPQATSCTITQSQDKKARVVGAGNTHNPLTKTNLNAMELIMAKPNDTRITHAPANAAPSNSSPTPADNNLTPILEALLAKQANRPAAPIPPKSARPAQIKPRRRMTVTASHSGDASLPWIRLCGHWLTQAGFALHTRVRVHVAHGVLILTTEDER
jgi:hypothetical protein